MKEFRIKLKPTHNNDYNSIEEESPAENPTGFNS